MVVRRLLQDDYHCSGSDTLLGSANVGASIFILLLVGCIFGAVSTSLSMLWWGRRKARLAAERSSAWQPQNLASLPDVDAMVRAAKTPTIRDGPKPSFRTVLSPPPQAACSSTQPGGGATHTSPAAGPLKRGWQGLTSWAGSSPSPQGQSPPQDKPCPTTSPFQGVPSYNVMTNPAVAASIEGPLSGQKQAAASPPASATAAAAPEDELIASAVFNPMGVSDGEPCLPHARRVTMVEHGGGPGGERAQQPSVDYAEAVHGRGGGGAELGAQPYGPAPAAVGQGAEDVEVAKQHHKQEMLSAVQLDSYSMHDLDPEWRVLLESLDARLRAAGSHPLSDRERAVAIRSLVVATASRSAEEAMEKALADVRLNRLTHRMMRRA
ncbi:hypothetical protein ACKKBG_A16675 [Auxenochlorella protothecoides x Auxenochlorella symbiontica]